ncbi:FapA family protein [Clostridiaceae bacterium M8S5]|nr:FapA family protein [Clostridiaceae bacterium M8S5]
MKEYVIVEGKNLEKLKEEVLEQIDRTIEEVDITILEDGQGTEDGKYKIKITYDTVRKAKFKTVELTEKIEFKFLNQGVCMKVLDYYASELIMVSDIVEYLDNKKVNDYDLDKIKDVIQKRRPDLITIAPVQEENLIDEKLVIDITDDKMKAYMVYLPSYGGKKISYQEALSQINEKISYGIIESEIKDAIENKKFNQKTLIAEGKETINGENGYITYHFNDKRDITPEILEDGTVDYRNLHILENVKKDQLLCEMTRPMQGHDGISILGETIEHKPGKEVNIKCGQNVILSEDEEKLYAGRDGQIKIISGKINVLDTFEVKGNVDNNTGNIKFNGTVIVKGNVKSGFEINAYGDVIVEGVVEAARINSHGTITLKRGIQGGKKAYLTAKGDIIAKYIENCKMFSYGNIIACAIMHSDIACDGSIMVSQKKGLIVGGCCKAREEIHAKIVGSEMETKTIIEVGADPKIKEKYNNVCNHLIKLRNNMDKLDKNITLLNRLLKTGKLDDKKKQLLVSSLNARKAINVEYGKLSIEQENLSQKLSDLSKGALYVTGVVHPGVKITIGNDITFIKKQYTRCKVYIKDKEIAFGSI